MTQFPFQIAPLGKESRSEFDCGIQPLNTYFKNQVTQDIRRKVTSCFVLTETVTKNIAGFYTLSASHVKLESVAPEWQKKLPKYPYVPAVRLGRLAIDLHFQGLKLGSAMLSNAASRAARNEISMHLMIVDAKSEKAARFYEHHGFRIDTNDKSTLMAPLSKIAVNLNLNS